MILKQLKNRSFYALFYFYKCGFRRNKIVVFAERLKLFKDFVFHKIYLHNFQFIITTFETKAERAKILPIVKNRTLCNTKKKESQKSRSKQRLYRNLPLFFRIHYYAHALGFML